MHGPYGGFNLGDDAIAAEIAAQLRAKSVSVTFSVSSREIRTLHGCPCILAPNLRAGKLGVLTRLRQFDAIVIGGGEQITEPRVPNPFWGHLATVAHFTVAAKRHHIPVAWLAVGVSARLSLLGRILVRVASAKVVYISVRDSASRKRLTSIVRSVAVQLGADPVFLQEPTDRTLALQNTCERFRLPQKPHPFVLIIPSNDRFHSLAYLGVIRSLSDRLARLGVRVIYAVSDLQPGYDLRIFRDNLLPTGTHQTWIPGGYVWNDLRNLIAAASCVISSRMHPLISAFNSGTPFYCISRSAKMEALMNQLHCLHFSTIDNLNVDAPFAFAVASLNKSSTVRRCEEETPHIRTRALRQFEEMCQALTKAQR